MSSEKLKYISYGQTVDGTNYCSGVETLAENLIEDNEQDAVIVFPSEKGWAGMRSEQFRMTTENTRAVFPLPMYKIIKFYIKIPLDKVKTQEGWALNEFFNAKGENISSEIDITKYIVPETEWNALPLAKSKQDYLENIRKDNTLYWKEGDFGIDMISTAHKVGGFLGAFEDTSPVYERMLKNYLVENGKGYIWNGPGNATYYLSDIPYMPGNFSIDVRKWTFRIEYVPISSKVKLRARKSEKTNFDYIQPHNQRAEVNAVSAFGKNMWLEAQKTGVQTLTVVKRYTKLADIPPVGALVLHNGKRYRLTANSYKQTNTIFLQVTHTLSENWTSKSKHVSVDQKYRNYSIPQETVWRNLYWEDFITVSGKKTEGIIVGAGINLRNAMRLFFNDIGNDKTVDSFCLLFNEATQAQGIGVAVPCATYGIANSMVFSATFKDQLSAGLRMALGSNEYCEETLYCSNDGKLQTARFVLSDGLESFALPGYTGEETAEDFARKLYPSITDGETPLDDSNDTTTAYVIPIKANYPKAVLFDKTFYVDKDPGEALKFTYQVHFVTDGGDCVLGNKISEHNSLIKRYDSPRTFRIWLLKSQIRNGVDILQPEDGSGYLTQAVDGGNFNCDIYNQGESRAKISLIGQAKSMLPSYNAWAITDENNNLYVGRNENSEGVVYFAISHKRI